MSKNPIARVFGFLGGFLDTKTQGGFLLFCVFFLAFIILQSSFLVLLRHICILELSLSLLNPENELHKLILILRQYNVKMNKVARHCVHKHIHQLAQS